ncbi:MAG: hypothetical protein GPJ52_01875 [Candidatus Heimdallarchaeota archaeon]|nr:hypothetical protein [Candidatus Heimdallarchaeota archaeon]
MLEIENKTIQEKLRKKYPEKIDDDAWADESKSFGFCKTNEYILKRKDWYKDKRRKTTLEEIRKAIALSEKLRICEFYLKDDVIYSIGNMELILEDFPEEAIKEITVAKDNVLILETTFGFFVLTCWISSKSYSEFQQLVKKKKKFFGKTCIECEKPATVYDSYTDTFSCTIHAPEETVYNEVYLEYLEGHNF